MPLSASAEMAGLRTTGSTGSALRQEVNASMSRKLISQLGLVVVVILALASVSVSAAATQSTNVTPPARSTAVGTVSSYTDAGISSPEWLAAGPDGALWFTNPGNDTIGRITTGGTVTSYSDAGISGPDGITAGPDGALWFTNDGSHTIGRITTGGAVTTYGDPSIDDPYAITAGPDGALWFTNHGTSSIGRITTGGVITAYRSPGISGPDLITAGPDGALWFTNFESNTIGRITTSGAFSSYADPGISGPQGIAAGPDGALWFTNLIGSTIGRITPAGTVTTFDDPSIHCPFAIAAGPDGALWFADPGHDAIGRIQAIVDTTPPTITAPPRLTVDATGPAGAFVTYAATAADEVDPRPTLTCSPASGAMFPVGDTTAICSATDAAGNTAAASFVVHVRSAAEQLVGLATAVERVGPGKSLADKIAHAQAAVDRGNATAAQSILKGFIGEVNAQTGKSIPGDSANALVEAATRIGAVLG